MAWRGLHLSEAARISLNKGRLLVEPESGASVAVPLEDVAYVVLDTPRVMLTAALLSAAAANGCLVITTDRRHMPNGALLPCNGYHRQAQTARLQMALTSPRRKRLWQAIVRRKIESQALSLELGGVTAEAQLLLSLVKKVHSGDTGNVEAQAARQYWPGYRLSCGVRTGGRTPRRGDRLDSLLDYGYAIVRACIARYLSAYGFWPSLGVHHANDQNPFNLADDLLEPLRPLVDVHARNVFLTSPEKENLDIHDRRAMTMVLHKDVFLKTERHVLLEGVRRYVEAFRATLSPGNGKDILLPVMADSGGGTHAQ